MIIVLKAKSTEQDAKHILEKIEQAGLKGKKVGDVKVSEKQALVLINEGKATGKQLKEMVSLVKASVAKQFSINLEHEVRLVSETGEVTIGDN